jgi:hypothetical protein
LDETGFIQGFAIIGGGILAAAIGVMDQARRGALSLDGHGQGSDGEFGAQMITHRPTNNLPGEEIQYDGQIEPSFGGWHVGDVGQPSTCFVFPSTSRVAVICGSPSGMFGARLPA